MKASDINRLIAPLGARIRMMVGRAVLRAVDDAKTAQALQLDLLDGEAQDGVERFQNYGLTSHPHPGAEALAVFVGGLRSHAVVIAVEDRRFRLLALEQGEVALYDDQGQMVKLARDGIDVVTEQDVRIECANATVTADSVLVDADQVDLGGEGGDAVARIGDSVDPETHIITSGSSKVFAA